MYKESQEGYCAWFLEVDLRELAVAELEKTLGQTMKRPEQHIKEFEVYFR